MKTIVSLSKKDIKRMSDKELVEKAIKVHVFPDFKSRKQLEERVFKNHFKRESEKRTDFWSIHEKPDYYEVIENEKVWDGYDDNGIAFKVISGRSYIECEKCGFISYNDIDNENPCFNLHCKCGGNCTYAEFSHEEYDDMVRKDKESKWYGRWMEDDYREVHESLVKDYLKKIERKW